MSSLYDIAENLRIIEEYAVDPETGEMLEGDELKELYDSVQMSLTDKIENTACFIKNLLSDAEQIKAEEDRLKARRIRKEKLAESLKKYMDGYISMQFMNEEGEIDGEALHKYKFETPRTKLSYRKSEVVEVYDETKIPKEFIKVETKETPMKAEIKKAIKNGAVVEGATVVTKNNLTIG